MKKRDFLFAGLLLMSAPMLAQEIVPEGPTRTKDDAKVIFEQGFESDWNQFQDSIIDVIPYIEYYNHQGDSSKQSISQEWIDAGTITRDSVIYLKNGVLPSDDAIDKELNGGVDAFQLDQWDILTDQDNTRNDKLSKFGVDGGSRYFTYKTDHKLPTLKSPSDANAYSKGVVANYRRNLFVRGLPVEPETSYRLTLYLKVNQPLKTDVVPTFFADIMQGYFHSEKPFLSTVEESRDWWGNPSKTFNSFEYKQTEFTGDWEKVTFMAYYNGDSLQSYIYNNQYYWSGNEWKWDPENTKDVNKMYFFIKQPQKYFVRLSFASDSTDFFVDNISLTKSWIGGVEYYNNKIRVDFGYETNLKDLAQAKFAETNIAAIELPGEYFKVLGYYAGEKDDDGNVIDATDASWYEIPINSAEYHGDGYMYMWTKDDEFGDPITFDYYDTVLVSFTNPVEDAELALKYTNSKIYPKSTDEEWVAAGKMVPDFFNELATPNPNVFDGVYSMKNLPPVVQKLEYEDGSFQLPVTTTSLSFSFSRPVQCEEGATVQTEHSALLKLVGNGKTEYWLPDGQSHDGDSTVVFVRPAASIAANGNLDGDYEIQLSQICGYGTDDAQPVSYKYSFGDVKMPANPVYVSFGEFEEEAAFTKGVSQNVAGLGFSAPKTATKIKSFPGKYGKALMFGNYAQAPGGQSGSEKTCMKLIYTFTAKESGNALVEFGWTGCLKNSWNDDCTINVVITDMEGNEVGRVSYGSSGYKPEEGATVNEVASGSVSGSLVKDQQYQFIIFMPNESGDSSGHLGGLVLYYLNISYGMCLGTPYVLAFDNAFASLSSTLDAAIADADNYTGEVFNASAAVQKKYADFKSEKETRPSAWNKVTAEIKASNSSLTARMGVVDAMWAAWDAADLKASETLTADEKFAGNAAYNALINLLEEVDAFIPSGATDDSIKAVQKSIEDASAALETRKTLMSDFNSELARAAQILEDKTSMTDLPEFAELARVYDELSGTDIYTTPDADLTADRDALKNASNAYVSQVSAMKVRTIRLKELAKEATANGVVFDEAVAAEYASRVENATDEDLALENVYKQAIKLAIYKKIAESKSVENIDLTGFIRNFNLFVTAKVVDRHEKGMPNDAGSLGPDENGAQIQIVNHSYNNVPVYIMIQNVEFTDLYPGWKVKAYPKGSGWDAGNQMVTPDDDSYSNFKTGATIFDGQLAMDWNSKADLSSTYTDLPAGLYKVGFELKANKDGGTKFSVATADTTASASYASGVSGIQWIDSIATTDGNIDASLTLVSGDGWSIADNFCLTYINKIDGFDYEAAIAAEEQKLSEMITFVDAFGADAAVEYIGLDGRMMTAPKAGQVSIKVTRKADGARVIEKVLVK